MKKAVKLSRQTLYESEWLNLHIDRVQYPGGRITEKHHCIDFLYQGVGAIVTDQENRLLLIRSYRYIMDTVDWEIPAGGFKDEDVMSAAEREVLEETGYACEDFKKLYSYYPMTGISNSYFHIVACKAVKRVADFDPNEVHSIQWFTRDEVRELLRQKKVQDGFSLQGISFYLMDDEIKD